LGEIKGINIAALSQDGKFLYAADGDLGLVGVIDPVEGQGRQDHPRRQGSLAHLSEPRRQVRHHAEQRRRDHLDHRPARRRRWRPRSRPGPDMTGVKFAAGKAFVISSTSGFVYVYDMNTLRPAGRMKIGTNIQLETATTDTKDETLYLADSTENAVVIINAKNQTFEKITKVGLYPWGTPRDGQQG
jgi:YVTN family beta-propeller protein